MKKLSLVGVAFLILATAGFAMAQTPRTQTIQLAQKNNSGVTGTAVVTETGGGVRVQVTVKGLKPNQKSAGHIHSARCAVGGPVVFPLNTITADAQGNGTADTTVANAPYATVANGNHYVQYHTSDSPPGPEVTCGDVVAIAAATGGAAPAATTAAAAAGGQGGSPAAPRTGFGGDTSDNNTLPTWSLLAALLVVLTGAGATYTVIRQRNK